jgi:hypothetical protein
LEQTSSYLLGLQSTHGVEQLADGMMTLGSGGLGSGTGLQATGGDPSFLFII